MSAPKATKERSTGRPLFLSLRSRLIASHGAVLLLALALVLAISAAYLRRYETAAEKERIEQLAETLTISTNFLGRAATAPRNERRIEAIDAQADELGLRLIVLSRTGEALYDSEETGALTGRVLREVVEPVRVLLRRADRQTGVQQLWVTPEQDGALAGELVLLSAGGPGRQGTALAIVAPDRRFPLLARFLPRLLLVVAISLGVASVAGYWLSRRIAAPVDRLTRAADAMATGRLEQRVEGEGLDEIGRLVTSFNAMSRQVAATSRSQRDLLANVAHELRTPLTSLQGYARAITDDVFENDLERERALATIGRESERMASLINQLLDLARLESGQTRLVREPVAIPVLLDRARDRFRPRAEEAGVTIEVEAGDADPVDGDEGRLLQVLSNLVDNALRHTPAGGTIRLAASRLAAPGEGRAPAVRLTVADTGEGIDEAMLPTVFERFTRDDGGATGADRRGFGLGLAIAREIVHQHQGSVAVASRRGAGTTFVVDLPAAE